MPKKRRSSGRPAKRRPARPQTSTPRATVGDGFSTALEKTVEMSAQGEPADGARAARQAASADTATARAETAKTPAQNGAAKGTRTVRQTKPADATSAANSETAKAPTQSGATDNARAAQQSAPADVTTTHAETGKAPAQSGAADDTRTAQQSASVDAAATNAETGKASTQNGAADDTRAMQPADPADAAAADAKAPEASVSAETARQAAATQRENALRRGRSRRGVDKHHAAPWGHALSRFWGIPTAAHALGLALLIGGTVSLKHAALLAIAFFCTAVVVYPVFALFGGRLPTGARLPALLLLAGAVFCAVRALAYTFAPFESAAAEPYLTLCAVSAALFWREESSVQARATLRRPRAVRALLCACRDAVGLAFLLLPLAFVRELVGAGRLWGVALGTPRWSFWALPPGGFVLLGLGLGALAALRARKAGKEAHA